MKNGGNVYYSMLSVMNVQIFKIFDFQIFYLYKTVFWKYTPWK